MRARPPAAEARVGRDVVGELRLGRLQHRAEHPVRARERTHGLDQLVAHPGRDEAGERALAVGDAERGVARAAELARGVDDPLQHGLDLVIGGDREHDVAQRAEGGALHARVQRYAPERRVQSGAGPRTLPGLKRPSGSSAVLIARIIASAFGPCSSSRNAVLPYPTPCSPVQVPS